MNDGRNKIFIPMSIDQNSTSREGYFSSPLKVAVAIVGIIPGIPWGLYALKVSNDSFQVLAIALLLYAFLYSYLIRFFVFEERRLKRLMKTLDRNKVSRADYFWGIDEIDAKGVIKYKYSLGLRRAVVVKVTRGSAVGVPDSFEDNFTDLNLKFTRSLLSQGFSFMKYTKMEEKQLPEGLNDCFRRMERIKDDGQRTVMKMNLETISSFTKDYKSVIVDYYIVSNTNLRLLSTFQSLVADAVRTTYGNDTYFRGTSLLNKDEVIEFIEDVSNVKGITGDGYYETEDRKFDEYGEVFRVFDEDDNEIYLDLENDVTKDIAIDTRTRGKSIDELEAEYSKALEDELEESDEDDDGFGDIDDLEDELEDSDSDKATIDLTKPVEVLDVTLDIDDIDAADEKELNVDLEELDELDELDEEDGVEYLTLYEDEDGNIRDEDGNIVDDEGNVLVKSDGTWKP